MIFPSDLTWSAVANNPDGNCNPGLAGIIGGDKNKVSFDKTSIVGLVIWMFCILYSSLRSASAAASLSPPDPERQGLIFRLHFLLFCRFLMISSIPLSILVCWAFYLLLFFDSSHLSCLMKYSINNSYPF
jgi:hypothetical protein